MRILPPCPHPQADTAGPSAPLPDAPDTALSTGGLELDTQKSGRFKAPSLLAWQLHHFLAGHWLFHLGPYAPVGLAPAVICSWRNWASLLHRQSPETKLGWERFFSESRQTDAAQIRRRSQHHVWDSSALITSAVPTSPWKTAPWRDLQILTTQGAKTLSHLLVPQVHSSLFDTYSHES